MAQRNGYAALVKQRSGDEPKTKRRKLDDYETPSDVTVRLIDHFFVPTCADLSVPIYEPACGSGRMIRTFKTMGFANVKGGDIKQGVDFLKRTAKIAGDCATNPPYRNGLAERFARHALKLTDGRVAMLMQSGFVWGDKRGRGLFQEFKPSRLIVIPERIYFLVNGKPIPSQFFSHAWVCWPDRSTRERGRYDTKTIWAFKDEEEFES